MAKTWILLALALAVVLPGCGGGGDDPIKELTALLESITDEASAKAAVPKIKELSAKIKANPPKIQMNPGDSPEKAMAALQEQMKAMGPLMAAAAKLQAIADKDPEVRKALDSLKGAQ
mgnify:CR=1 FL=1